MPVDGTGAGFLWARRHVTCPLGCGAEVREERLGEHMDDECALRRLPCDACGLPLPLESHSKHLAESCQRVPRRCTNGEHVALSGEGEHNNKYMKRGENGHEDM